MNIKHLILAAFVAANVFVGFLSCSSDDDGDGNNKQEITVTTLKQTYQSWDGTMLPKYPQSDTTQLSFLLYQIPAHTKMTRHFHPIMSYGYVLNGELTVVADGGKEMTFKTGEALVETVNTWHYGENRGDEDVLLVVGYNGIPGIPLAVKEGEGNPGDYSVYDKSALTRTESTAASAMAIELLQTYQSWDGTMLPKYPQNDTTQLTCLLYKIPAHSVMDRHFHPIMSYGFLIEGELTVVSDAGDEMTFEPGEIIVETVNTWHHGENRGDKDVLLVVGYNGAPGLPLAVKEGQGNPGDY